MPPIGSILHQSRALPDILHPGLEIKIFLQGALLHIHKLEHKGVVYMKQYIFGLPAEILGSHRRVQGSAGLLVPVYFEP